MVYNEHVNSNFFSSNRKRLAESLDADLLILTGYIKLQDVGDTAHAFRQEPNFWYLTGIEYPGWQLVVDVGQDTSWLIAPSIDKVHQIFDGSLQLDEARVLSGVDKVISKEEGDALIENLSRTHKTAYTLGIPSYAEHVDFSLNPAPKLLREKLQTYFREIKDCQKAISRLRAIKQPEELKAIKDAARISMAAIQQAKVGIGSGKYEYEIEAEIGYHFRRHNAEHAFDPIVASGKNACTLHYVQNSSGIHDSSLLLIDVGARLRHYSGDITRTYGVGEITERQRSVHLGVQTALKEIMKLPRPGLSTKRYIELTDDIMKHALLSLGLMKKINDTDNYRKYFPHAISHGLGLEVHESLGGFTEFMPGMVVTVEPGIYISEENIGVRIEHDIVITENGNENLTLDLSTDL